MPRDAGARLPMFPLSTVLFPHGALPLHVFEPRYRALVADCLMDDRRFGVVLIARGSEVGGGDERVHVGTTAVIEVAQPTEDGRWHIIARGIERIRVSVWLPDEPYPVASVDRWPCDPPVRADLLGTAEREVRRVRTLLSELGDAAALPARLGLDDDPDAAAWQLCSLAPVGAFDGQRLLEAPGHDERLELLVEMVRGLAHDLTTMLGGG
jgi:uncharacterized protein